jgi:hypothetical protein
MIDPEIFHFYHSCDARCGKINPINVTLMILYIGEWSPGYFSAMNIKIRFFVKNKV